MTLDKRSGKRPELSITVQIIKDVESQSGSSSSKVDHFQRNTQKKNTPTAQHCVQCSSSRCPARSVMVCQTETAFRSNSPSGITARLRRENMMRRTQVVGGRSKPKNLFICSKHTERNAKFWLSKYSFVYFDDLQRKPLLYLSLNNINPQSLSGAGGVFFSLAGPHKELVGSPNSLTVSPTLMYALKH